MTESPDLAIFHSADSARSKGSELSSAPDATFVLIVSTFCNLRCKYCYEYPDLGNRHRMSVGELERLFVRVAEHYAGSCSKHLRFAWQGGEPLLHEPAYYRSAFARQEAVFRGSPHRITNVLQSNLTILDGERTALLCECFDGVGVSHDVVGDLRVDAGGRSRARTVEANLDRLIQARVPIGGITVLNKQNAGHMRAVYEFWQGRALPFRLLPMHRGPFPALGDAALAPEEVLRAMCECADLWLSDIGQPKPVAPITEMAQAIVYAKTIGRRSPAYDRRAAAPIYILNPSGFVGGINDLLDLADAYGNLFDQSLAQILGSSAYARSANAASEQVRRICTDCPYFQRACSGHPVGEGGKEFWRKDAQGKPLCVIQRSTLAHIERRLTEAGLFGDNPPSRAT